MDSGNSGSMQSSSCGDEIEDYDSRADSNNFSALLNNQPPSTTRINHVLNTPSHPSSSSSSLPQQQHQMFDPLVNYYMDSLQKASPTSNQNQNSFLNLDMMWAKATGRSEPNNTDLSSLMVPSSSSQQNHHQQAFLLSQLAAGQTRENVASVPTTHQHQHQQHHSLPQESTSRGGISLTNDQQNLNNNNNNMGRNPKKRSRASRRAPTTVLTTDTTNFRAMVQEFTGIPAPPFSSPFPRTRLDLFGSSVSSRSLSSQMDPPLHQAPPYLLRPFAQKIQPQPQPHYSFSQIPSSFPSLENLASNNSTNSASINYHNHPLMQHNQILGFQSISSPQAPTKYPHGPQQPSLEISPKMGVFEELGLSHAHAHVNNNNNTNNNNIGVLHQQNMVPASSERVTNNNMRNTTSEDQWGQRTSSTTSINGDNDVGGGRILGSLSGIQERNSGASDFGIEKGQECGVVVATTTRGEGTVESWINCSSSD